MWGQDSGDDGETGPVPRRELTTAAMTTQTTTGAPAAHCETRGRGADRRLRAGSRAPGGSGGLPTWPSRRVAKLPLGDRSSDRNEQHCAAFERHQANAVRTRRAGWSGICTHLLIAGPPSSPTVDERPPGRARAPRVPLLRVRRGQQRSLVSFLTYTRGQH
jgi:hypothetical protein